jgi:micrococcal nuclease
LHTDPDAPKPAPAGDVAWVEPTGDVCPTTHPVKAKLGSKIFHLPGGQMYDRTKPDRCYRDGDAAEADGLRQAKR